MNYLEYYFKIGSCKFNDPLPRREAYTVSPKLVQVANPNRVGSGKIIIKELPNKPPVIKVEFPIMTPTQFRTYWNALQSMYLNVEFFDESVNSYRTWICYHTDLNYKPIKYEGREMILFEPFELIGH